MKAQLILLENPIIVTGDDFHNKNLEPNDFAWHWKQKEIVQVLDWHSVTNDWLCLDGTNRDSYKLQKIISNNKPIDYNGIDFGILDVEKLALEKYPLVEGFKNISKDIENEKRRDGFIEGFKASKQLNEKKFTSDDMIEFGKFIQYGNHEYKSFQNILKEWIEQASIPKTFDIEIEETPANIKIIKKL